MTVAPDIRALEPGEVPACMSLWRASAAAAHPFLGERELDAEAAHVEAALRDGGDVLVAALGNDLVAFIALDGPAIAGLFVAPDAQRHGIGAALVRRAWSEGRARSVEVYARNAGAGAFYRWMGYVVAGRRPTDDLGRPHELLHLRLECAFPLARDADRG